jgi:leucyl-tRNA synthetase
MIFVNEVYKLGKCKKSYAEGFVKMISCVCPHVGEELWEMLGHNSTIAYEPSPSYDEYALAESEVNVAVQVTGKVRANMSVAVDATEDEIREKALAIDKVKVHTDGKTVVKVIIIKGKIVNIVVK